MSYYTPHFDYSWHRPRFHEGGFHYAGRFANMSGHRNPHFHDRQYRPYKSQDESHPYSSRQPWASQSYHANDRRSEWKPQQYANMTYDRQNERQVTATGVLPNEPPVISAGTSAEGAKPNYQADKQPVRSRSPLDAWKVVDEVTPFVSPTPTSSLILFDDLRYPICAAKDLAAVLCALEDPEWPERTFQGKIQAVVTLSRDGRWLAMVVCLDERAARGLKRSLELEEKARLKVEFLDDGVLVTAPLSEAGWCLESDLARSLTQKGVTIEPFDMAHQELPASQSNSKSLPVSTMNPNQNAQKTVSGKDTAIEMPDSVAKDHRKTPAIHSNKKLASHISRWNAQQSELRAEVGTTSNGASPAARGMEDHGKEPQIPDTSADEGFDYTDEVKRACLLCQRQFKSIDVLRRHATESDLHRRNLHDEGMCSAGRKRKRGSDEDKATGQMKRASFMSVEADKKHDNTTSTSDVPSYRDRASERRVVFGMEKVGGRSSFAKKNKNQDKSPPAAQTTTAPVAPAALDETSIGGALLAKMGWSAGQGLGANGSGRVSPIEAHVYEQGAGIGSRQGDSQSGKPMTVEECSIKRARFVSGGYSSMHRFDKMRQRYGDDQ